MTPDQRPVRIRVIKDGRKVRPRRGLGEWIRAWKTVMRDPDKVIPDPGIGPEGQPIPVELDIHCEHCRRPLAGLTEWVCPSCGEQFNPIRAYTLRMMQEPEYFLRYRLDPEDIRKTFWALVLFVAGLVMVLVATVLAAGSTTQTGWLPIRTAYKITSAFIGLTVPITFLLWWGMDVVLPRILFVFSVLWLLLCTALLVLTFI